MNHQQIRDIAEAAFKAHFGHIDIVSINIKPGFDHYHDPLVDVKIIYDGQVEELLCGDTIEVRSEIIDKVWAAEDSPGRPQVYFIAKSDICQHDPATVRCLRRQRAACGGRGIPY